VVGFAPVIEICSTQSQSPEQFQACSFNHSDIFRFRINDLRAIVSDYRKCSSREHVSESTLRLPRCWRRHQTHNFRPSLTSFLVFSAMAGYAAILEGGAPPKTVARAAESN